MPNKTDIAILLAKTKNYEYLLYELFKKKIKESKILYIIPHNLPHASYQYLIKR